ncbi:MAG TPA: hypothetical protein DCQ04_16775 [Actinobacteria bacterium]|nr:hypothetical protein [Actinomycetota bacterium]
MTLDGSLAMMRSLFSPLRRRGGCPGYVCMSAGTADPQTLCGAVRPIGLVRAALAVVAYCERV